MGAPDGQADLREQWEKTALERILCVLQPQKAVFQLHSRSLSNAAEHEFAKLCEEFLC